MSFVLWTKPSVSQRGKLTSTMKKKMNRIYCWYRIWKICGSRNSSSSNLELASQVCSLFRLVRRKGKRGVLVPKEKTVAKLFFVF